MTEMRHTILYLCLGALPMVSGLSFAPWTALAAAEAPKDELYSQARKDLDDGRFNAAAEKFGRVAQRGGSDADAALYWKAYAQNKAGKPADALATVRQLGGAYPKSSWMDDAKALEQEIRGESGKPPNPSGPCPCCSSSSRGAIRRGSRSRPSSSSRRVTRPRGVRCWWT